MTQLSGSMWVIAAALAALPGTSAALTRLDASGRCTITVNRSLNTLLTCNDTASILAGSGSWSEDRYGPDNAASWAATAAYGTLKSASSSRGSTALPGAGAPTLMDVNGTSFAQWRDEITFNAPGLAGQSGFFEASLRVGGTLGIGTNNMTYGNANSSWGISFELSRQGRRIAAQGLGGTLSADFRGMTSVGETAPSGLSFNIGAPIVFGQTYQMDMILGTSTSTNVRPKGVPGDVDYLFPISSNAVSSFGSTATWSGIQSVTLANGDPVLGWNVASTSGLDYAQPVPEPATLSLWAGGVLMLAALARRRRMTAAS